MEKKEKEIGSIYKDIESRCTTLGISVSELSRQSGVKRQVFANWKNKNPKSITQQIDIEKTLVALEAEKKQKEDDLAVEKLIDKTGGEC